MAVTFPDDDSEPPFPAETTAELIALARQGDVSALDRLFARAFLPLRRWAHGRLPPSLRGAADTADLVQETAMAALKHLSGGFEPHQQGAVQAYLRQAVLNRIRHLVRQAQRHPSPAELPDQLAAGEMSPLDRAIGAENVERYERALARLSAQDREAIIGRIELQYDHDALAATLGKPSASAARMAVARAMKRLASEIARW
jgi:RNA polymerase sigma-70 factor (ECF subfamily)